MLEVNICDLCGWYSLTGLSQYCENKQITLNLSFLIVVSMYWGSTETNKPDESEMSVVCLFVRGGCFFSLFTFPYILAKYSKFRLGFKNVSEERK